MVEQVVDAALVGTVGEGDRAGGIVRFRDAAAEVIDRPAARDREQPGEQPGAFGVIARRALPRLQEHLLLDVLGGRAITEDPQQEAERGAPVQRVQLAQRLGIAAGEPLGEASLCSVPGATRAMLAHPSCLFYVGAPPSGCAKPIGVLVS